jgi:hypothetical protein
MSSVVTPVEELVNSRPDQDNSETFAALWSITCAMFEKVKARFELTMDPATADLQPYAGQGGAAGHLAAYAGPEIDWLIHSWTGNPKASFTNMHLTVNLGPHVDAPNFGFALGTIPDLFWYMDTMPRRELVTHPDYADRHWGGAANAAFLAQHQVDGFRPFVSRDVYTRVALSPNAFCYSAPISDKNLAVLEAACHAGLERWFAMVEKADPVPPAERPALAARDEFIRRTICERDPANVVAEKLFGKPLTDRLVATLWGGTRTLPRPA